MNSSESKARSRPVVGIWRNVWLPASETFVRAQARSHVRWSPWTFGAAALPGTSAAQDEQIVWGSSPTERLGRSAFKVTRSSRRLERLTAAAQVRIVHAHFGPDATVIGPTTRRLGLPLVVTLHGFDVSSALLAKDWKSRLYQRRLLAAHALGPTFLAVSSSIRDRALAFGLEPQQTRLHYLGVEVPDFRSDVARLDVDVLFVGRLTDKKGVEVLVDAIVILAAKLDVAPRVVVIGDGPLRQSLISRARQARVRVDFLGALSHTETLGYMERARVLAVPSRTAADGDVEGLPTVIMEAAARGLPAVGTHHSGIPEVIEHGTTGLLIAEDDPPALADAIGCLLRDDTLRRGLGERAAALASAKFNIARQVAILEELYDELVSRSHA